MKYRLITTNELRDCMLPRKTVFNPPSESFEFGDKTIGVQLACDMLDIHGLDICTGDKLRVTDGDRIYQGWVDIVSGSLVLRISSSYVDLNKYRKSDIKLEIVGNVWNAE